MKTLMFFCAAVLLFVSLFSFTYPVWCSIPLSSLVLPHRSLVLSSHPRVANLAESATPDAPYRGTARQCRKSHLAVPAAYPWCAAKALEPATQTEYRANGGQHCFLAESNSSATHIRASRISSDRTINVFAGRLVPTVDAGQPASVLRERAASYVATTRDDAAP